MSLESLELTASPLNAHLSFSFSSMPMLIHDPTEEEKGTLKYFVGVLDWEQTRGDIPPSILFFIDEFKVYLPP